jgi:hypothetical protein
MFKAGRSIPDSKDRQLSSGYRTLSDRTGQDPKTIKRNRKGLLEKSCIVLIALDPQLLVDSFIEGFHVLEFSGDQVSRCRADVPIKEASAGGRKRDLAVIALSRRLFPTATTDIVLSSRTTSTLSGSVRKRAEKFAISYAAKKNSVSMASARSISPDAPHLPDPRILQEFMDFSTQSTTKV